MLVAQIPVLEDWYFQIPTKIFWRFLFVVQGVLCYISFCGPIVLTQGFALAGKTLPVSYTISFVILREYIYENWLKTLILLPVLPNCHNRGDEETHL